MRVTMAADERKRRRRKGAQGDEEALAEAIAERYARAGISILSDERPKRMDPTLRAEMETTIGSDMSGVRIHTDERAREMAESLGARAFAAGSRDVFFAEGEYDPASTKGKALLAHELTHLSEGHAGLARRQHRAQREGMEVRARRAEEMVLAREEQTRQEPEETEMLEPAEVEHPPDTRPEATGRPTTSKIDKAVLEEKVYETIERQSRRERERRGSR